MVSITIIDDHPMVLEGLTKMVNSSGNHKVMQSFSAIETARIGLEKLQTEIVLLDINLPDGNGILFCKEIVAAYPNTKVIAISNFE